MKMIVGGAFQGKTRIAEKIFSLRADDIINGAVCSIEECYSAVCIKNYHELIRRIMNNNIDPVEFTQKLCSENPEAVIIMDEIGCGIIPIEKNERIYRELTGRSGCIIAENSDLVIRVCCGIMTVIKGEINEDKIYSSRKNIGES